MVPSRDPLVDLLDDARAAEVTAGRERQRWLRRQAEEEATLEGALLDLAERATVVALRTTAGRVHHGRVVAVGTDFVVIGADRGGTCVRLSAVSSVRPGPGERHGPPTGAREPALDLLLVEVLGGLAPERPRVAIGTAAGEVVSGELSAVGADVVTVRLDGDGRTPCYVAMAAVLDALVEG